jgi:murein DD-endopeptidase MepM/ murein hydrolase activator NlpD
MDKLGIKKIGIVGLLCTIAISGVIVASALATLLSPGPSPVAFSLIATSSSSQVVVSTELPLSDAPSLSIEPASIEQGDPVMVTVVGVHASSSFSLGVKGITFAGAPLAVIDYHFVPTAFIGIALNEKSGTYPIVVSFTDGTILKKNIMVLERPKVVATLGVPAALGGNTLVAETNVVDSLAADNQVLAALVSAPRDYWSEPFQFPVADPVVTDIYGYTRQTGPYEIPHKGTDFKAPPGTPIMAINNGVVILAQDLGIYGNTIVVDHGKGIMSFYMHLSKISVKKGESVARGEVIGASGETGYAEGPHLHLTVRIDGVSIDPMVFLGFFQK